MSTSRPCGCTAEQLCAQHIQALPRRERITAQRATRCRAGQHTRNCPRDCPQKTAQKRCP